MTRTRSSTFQGTDPADCDVDSPQFKDVLNGIAKDIHLTYDAVTGENSISASQTIKHDGTSRGGSLLGMPTVSQTINKTIFMSSTDVGTYGGDIIIWAAPVYIPTGEHAEGYELRLGNFRYMSSWVAVYNSSGTLEQRIPLSYYEQSNEMGTLIQFPSSGLKYVFIEMSYSTGFEFFFSHINLWRVTFLDYSGGPLLDPGLSNQVSFTQTTAAATATSIQPLHDEYFGDEYATASKVLKDMRYANCKLYEYITGAPVVGNYSLTDSDSADVDPSESRYFAHTKSVFANEPAIVLPLFSDGLGAVQSDGSNTTNSTATAGFDDSNWFAPFVTTSASTEVVVHEVSCYCPDMPSGTLNGAMLFSGNAGIGGYTGELARVTLVGGGTSSDLAITQLGSLPFYIATFTSVDFDPDTLNTWQFIHNKGVKLFVMDESNVVGVCLYF